MGVLGVYSVRCIYTYTHIYMYSIYKHRNHGIRVKPLESVIQSCLILFFSSLYKSWLYTWVSTAKSSGTTTSGSVSPRLRLPTSP